MKGGNCFLIKVTKGTNLQGVQVCWEPHSFKVIYEGNVVWFSLFPFTSSLEAILSVYRNSKLQKLDIFSLDDDYVWSSSCRNQWDRHCQRGVFRGSVTWKVSIQGGLLQKMMLESFGEVGQDGINYLSIRLWERGRYCIKLGLRLQDNHDFMLYLQL